MIDTENRKQLALVLDDHAGAKLRGFDAAHNFSRPCGRRLLTNLRYRKFLLAAAELRIWLRAE
jgi:hypothetical protein